MQVTITDAEGNVFAHHEITRNGVASALLDALEPYLNPPTYPPTRRTRKPTTSSVTCGPPAATS